MRTAWLAAVLVVLVACGSGAGGAVARGDRNSINLEEVDAGLYPDAHALVRALRPQWLTTRGARSVNRPEQVKVYMDELLLGGPESLRQISTLHIQSIRYLDAIDATQRWGTDHGEGAIVISTRKRSAP